MKCIIHHTERNKAFLRRNNTQNTKNLRKFLVGAEETIAKCPKMIAK